MKYYINLLILNSNFSKYYIYNNNSYEITYCLIYESNKEKNNNLNN
jgi:hypothetical protein